MTDTPMFMACAIVGLSGLTFGIFGAVGWVVGQIWALEVAGKISATCSVVGIAAFFLALLVTPR